MKRIFILFLITILSATSFAQKKMIPVVQSALTGIALPAGSLQDKRSLSVSSACVLLESESKKINYTVSSSEVLEIPSESSSGFNERLLYQQLYKSGFEITVSEGDTKIALLQKGNQYLMMYFSIGSKASSLYFGIATPIPIPNPQENNYNNQLLVNNEENQTKQINDQSGRETPYEPTRFGYFKGFTFTTTNFDDGWVATEQADWVLAAKGNLKVLIHYPDKLADAYNSVLMDGLKNAWNVLVAPRYSSAANFEFKPISSWESIEFAEADMVEKASGKIVHVVLFKKNSGDGSGKYMEFISPDKRTFEQEFGAYHQSTSGWEKMENMATYNKFAVAPADLSGKWTSDFSGAIQYVNAYTGFDAGMNTNASAENFYFGPGNAYKWDLAVANGMVGNIKFQSVNSNGMFSMPNNWQVKFSDMEGKPRTYNVYFSCIKGLRVLWLQDSGYGNYKGYAKAK